MKRETKVTLVKLTVGIFAGVCVAAVATAAIKKAISLDDLPKINKVMYQVGEVIIVSLLAEQGSAYATRFVDSFLTGYLTVDQITNS